MGCRGQWQCGRNEIEVGVVLAVQIGCWLRRICSVVVQREPVCSPTDLGFRKNVPSMVVVGW